MFHAMDPAAMTFLKLPHELLITDDSHSVTDHEILYSQLTEAHLAEHTQRQSAAHSATHSQRHIHSGTLTHSRQHTAWNTLSGTLAMAYCTAHSQWNTQWHIQWHTAWHTLHSTLNGTLSGTPSTAHSLHTHGSFLHSDCLLYTVWKSTRGI